MKVWNNLWRLCDDYGTTMAEISVKTGLGHAHLLEHAHNRCSRIGYDTYGRLVRFFEHFVVGFQAEQLLELVTDTEWKKRKQRLIKKGDRRKNNLGRPPENATLLEIAARKQN